MSSSVTNQSSSAPSSTAGAFTPGPWTIVPYGDGVDLVIHCDGENRVCFMATPSDAGSFKTIKANARLISAAPDMYEALKAAIDVGLIPISSASEGGASRYSIQVRVVDQVRAALAKAEGRS